MRRSPILTVLALCAASPACASSLGRPGSNLPPLAAQWFDRARVSYRGGDFEDAADAAKHALAAAPTAPEVRELSARLALTRLDYPEALRLTEGIDTVAAHGIRGRAHWFSGDLEHAADELEAMLADPTVKDPWAREVAGLARRGAGRHPFEMDGGIVGAVEMPRAAVTPKDDDRIPLLVDSSRLFPLLLQDDAWKKAGVDLHTLVPIPDSPSMKRGMIPTFWVGGFDLAKMPAYEGLDLGEIATGIDIDLGGVVGADILAFFRVTLADGGRFMWIEPDPALFGPAPSAPSAQPASGPQPPSGPQPASGPQPPAAPAPASQTAPPPPAPAPATAPSSPSPPAKSHP
jgi:hypothetical protein